MKAAQFVVLALACVAIAPAVGAQDPVKLSPNLYTVLLENEHVRVLEFRAKPGDKEPMHSHPWAVVYVLTDGKAKATMPDGTSAIVEGKSGQTVWVEPVTHAWEQMDPGEGRVLIVEMKNPAMRSPATKKP